MDAPDLRPTVSPVPPDVAERLRACVAREREVWTADPFGSAARDAAGPHGDLAAATGACRNVPVPDSLDVDLPTAHVVLSRGTGDLEAFLGRIVPFFDL